MVVNEKSTLSKICLTIQEKPAPIDVKKTTKMKLPPPTEDLAAHEAVYLHTCTMFFL